MAARAGWRNDGVSEGSREPRCVPLLPLRLEPATCTSLFPQCSTRCLAAASEALARSESGSRARTTATRSGGGPSAPARTSRASASSSRTRLPRKCPREPHSKRLARQAVAPPRLSRKRAARAMMLAGGSASRTSCSSRAWAQGPCVRPVRMKDRRARSSRLCTREAKKVRGDGRSGSKQRRVATAERGGARHAGRGTARALNGAVLAAGRAMECCSCARTMYRAPAVATSGDDGGCDEEEEEREGRCRARDL